MFRKYEGRKTAALVAAVFSAFVLIFIALLFWVNRRVEMVDVSKCARNDTGSVTYGIEEKGDYFNYIYVNGYAYEPGVSIDSAVTKVLVRDTDTGAYYELPTENVRREDITEERNDGCNYDYAGFKSVAYKSELPERYTICILYECNNEKILIEE
ncbi:MAG: hypothetical protein UHU19_16690 [Lachnospiraceae bacterium]|nr:hypothetical protein [Lachnospiraceae bacterium]